MKIVTFAVALACMSALPTLSLADPSAFNKHCKKCHPVKAGKHLAGPSLAGIMGRAAGATDFKKYKVVKDSNIVWDEANIDAYITDPKKFAKDNGLPKPKIMITKVKSADERKAIIEHLKTLQ